MGTLGTIISGKFDEQPATTNGTSGGTDSTGGGIESDQGGIKQPESIAGYPAIEPKYTISGTEQPKRGRGRPAGSKNRGTETTSGAAGTSAGTTKAKEAGKNLASDSLANLEALLLSIHQMGAAFLSCPELELDEAEAKKLSTSIKNVAKHYPVIISEKKLAWADFAVTAGGIYGTRAVAIFAGAKKKEPKITAVPAPKAQEPTPMPSKTPRPLNPHEIYGDGSGGDNY